MHLNNLSNSSEVLSKFHFFDTEYGLHMLIADGSQVYGIEPELQQEIEAAAQQNTDTVDRLLQQYGLTAKTFIDGQPLSQPPLKALSLAVAQKCNLGCTYCYAQEGSFGGFAKNMSWEVAKAAVERLFEEAQPEERVNLSFLGGEPLVNRQLIQAATQLAFDLSQKKGVKIGFSITTNATLLEPEDADFFERYGFAVTVSLDGVGEVHDRTRSFKSGKGSYERVIANIKPLLSQQRQMQVSARVTVTPKNLYLRETLEHFIGLGFHSIGFSPMLSSPTGREQMETEALQLMLAQMIDCGQEFERQTVAGNRYPFANITSAIQQIHRGTHRPYPCGAGAGYMGVSAEGNLSACHRFVDDEAGFMGSLKNGIDREKQDRWLAERQVDRQEPCNSCWARYLCSGGCHYEVIHRGRPACDYIRGWLHFCLETYVSLLEKSPDYFTGDRLLV